MDTVPYTATKALLVLLLVLPIVHAATITVCASGCDNTTISMAVDAANTGDTISVSAGSYSENVNISKQLSLIGSGWNTTVNASNALNATIAIMNVSNVLIANLTLTGSNISGLYLTGAHNARILDVRSLWNFREIHLNESNNVTITGTTVQNSSGYGIYLEASHNSTIRNNTITDMGLYSGIILYSSHGARILNNTIQIVWTGVFAQDSSNLVIQENTIDAGGFGGVGLTYVSDSLVTENIITNSGISGVNALDCSNITISANTVNINDQDGILLWNCTPSTILRNYINASWNMAIYVGDSNNSIVAHNDINAFRSTKNEGIFLDEVSNSIFHHNNITLANIGFEVSSSAPFNTFHHNIVTDSTIAIYVEGDSVNNTLFNNTFIGSTSSAIVLENTYNNTIYNNFLNNSNNSYTISAANNHWNISLTPGTNIVGGPYIGGNFYATPNGTGFSETCLDTSAPQGICDTNRTITGQSTDYLTLSLNITDNDNPIIALHAPLNGSNVSSENVTINWTVTDGTLVGTTLVVDYNYYTTSSNAANTVVVVENLSAGTHNIHINASDVTGNTSELNTTFYVDTPFNALNFVTLLNNTGGLGSLQLTDGNGKIQTTNATMNLSGTRLNLGFSASTTNGSSVTISLRNFSAQAARFNARFKALGSDTATEGVIVGLGGTPQLLLSLANVSQFLNDDEYTATLIFNTSGVNYTHVYYCEEEGGEGCYNATQCAGNNQSAFDGSTACWTNLSSLLTVVIPHFSSIILSLDNITGTLNITAPDNSTALGTGSSVYLNFTASEAVTVNISLVHQDSNEHMTGILGTLSSTYSNILLGNLTQNVLPNGNYTAILGVVDAYGNADTVNYSFEVYDTAGPNVTDVTVGSIDTDSAEISLTAHEYVNVTILYGESSGNLDSSETETTFSLTPDVDLTGLEEDTKYYYRINATDVLGHSTITTTSNFDTDDSSSSSSSGGGGGGGGGGLPISTVEKSTQNDWSTSKTISRASSGEIVQIDFSDAGNELKGVALRMQGQAINFRITAQVFEQPPTGTAMLPGNVFLYLDIFTTNLDKEALQDAQITFSVPAAWVKAQGLTNSDIILYHFDNAWRPLPTELIQEGSTDLEYVATTPGFSLFAIGEAPQATAATLEIQESDDVDNAQNSEEPASTLEPQSKRPFPWLSILGVLFIGALLIAYVVFQGRRPPRIDEPHHTHVDETVAQPEPINQPISPPIQQQAPEPEPPTSPEQRF